MNFYSIILSMVTLLFSTSYTLGASNDSVNLHTYFCEGETEFGEFEPLIFKKYPENDWRLLSVYPVSNKLEKKLEDLTIKKRTDGFAFLYPDNPFRSAFLKQIGGRWILRFVDEGDVQSLECDSLTEFVNMLAPHLNTSLKDRLNTMQKTLNYEYSETKTLKLIIENLQKEINATTKVISEKQAVERKLLEKNELLSKNIIKLNKLKDQYEVEKEDLSQRILDLKIDREQSAGVDKLKLADAAAAQMLREKLVNLLAEKVALEKSVSLKLTDIQRQEILLSEAKVKLQGEKEINIESRLLVESLNQQLAEVRGQLGQLQSLLDASEAKDASEEVEIKNLSSKLNAALARAVSEQRKNSRALEAQNTKLKALALERDSALITLKDEKTKLADFQEKESKRLNSEAELLKERNLVLETITKERNEALQKLTKEKQLLAELKKKDLERLEAEAKELKKYQSKFFAEIEKALGDQEGIKIKGDRFIFSSEILFGKGEANISKEGLNQIKLVSDIITSISMRIPADINWILRVDGHTDNVPLSGLGIYKDNWEVSQARALSVVRYMSEELGVPSSRLAATGFGEHQPFDQANTEEARAKNRRIEIKLTER